MRAVNKPGTFDSVKDTVAEFTSRLRPIELFNFLRAVLNGIGSPVLNDRNGVLTFDMLCADNVRHGLNPPYVRPEPLPRLQPTSPCFADTQCPGNAASDFDVALTLLDAHD